MDPRGRAASRGGPPEEYQIHLAFDLSPIGCIPEFSDDGMKSAPVQVDGLEARIERHAHYFVLRIPHLQTSADADLLLQRIAVALNLLAVDKGISIGFDPIPIQVDRSEWNLRFSNSYAAQLHPEWIREDGSYTDAVLWTHSTSIVPEQERVWEMSPLWGWETQQLSLASIGTALGNTFGINHPERVLKHRKLMLAFEMFKTAYSNRDRRTRLIQLVTTLEILSDRPERPEYSRRMIEQIGTQLQHLSAMSNDDDEIRKEWKDLREAVLRLKRNSIGAGVRDLVYSWRKDIQTEDSSSISRQSSDTEVNDIYQIRSELIHEGRLREEDVLTQKERLTRAYERLRVIASGVLRWRTDRVLRAE